MYYEHWEEVGGDSVRLAVLETVPYALLILLGNIGLQYIFFGGTLLSGLIAVFLPNQVHTHKEVLSAFKIKGKTWLLICKFILFLLGYTNL